MKKIKELKIIESITNLDFLKIVNIIVLLLFLTSLLLNINYYLKPQQIIEKEVIKKEEIIKYVEKQGGTTTDKFIVYLNSRIDPITAKTISKAVDESSKKYSLPRKLVLSIINKESFFNPLAKSHKDCVGLMQVNPKAHKEKVQNIPKTHLYHIGINIDIGCKIFRQYFNETKGDLHKTFHSYLGKRASNQAINKYKNDILYTFAELEMYEYIGQKEKKLNDEKIVINVDSNIVIQELD